MAAGLETDVEENFNADKFVRETLTLSPALRGLGDDEMFGGLVQQVKKGIDDCKAKMGSTIGQEYSQYRSALSQLTKKLEEFKEQRPLAFTSNKDNDRPLDRKPYKACYGFAVINGDGVPRPTY